MAQFIALKKPVIPKRLLHSRIDNGTCTVIYAASFNKEPPAISISSRHHALAGEHGALQMIRRIKEILYEDYDAGGLPGEARKAVSEIRERFMHMLQVMPYRQLVKEGYVNQLLDDYLGLLIIEGEQQKCTSGGWQVTERYVDEREYYYHHSDEVKGIALQMKYLVIR